ncbi:RAMP superfamily CRISPR-associated protein [Thermogemmatispora carboxidivorans]|uniref:RAMP superfamily CRISPR-associated protein n=1 Tax=Thermogemmatispora carboxidivorans TaxID=1382306 RepID=UPI00069A2DA3|nr:RAMP superfamily CRISPR-associated protein [Thermogemmatispora carboxidivorans]
MKAFALLLQARAPLAIRADHAPSGFGCLDYLPGTSLAGSLAGLHRLLYPTQRDEFSRLFLSGRVQFPDLLLAPLVSHGEKKNKAQQEIALSPVHPLPRTAQSCKRHPGFKSASGQEADENGHGVRDTLFAWAAFALQPSDEPQAIKALKNLHSCPIEECSASMQSITGCYARHNGTFHLADYRGRRHLQTHTGIDRLRGTVQEEILYNREVLDEGTCFWGLVKASDEEAPLLQRFIEEAGHSGLVRIGTGRTRGLGAVELTLTPLQDAATSLARFRERLLTFDRRLKDYLASHELCNDQKPFYFALTLYSPTILCDEFLRYRGRIDETALAELLGPPFTSDDLRCLHTAAALRRVTGWNDLWGLPRPAEYAIERGSVFLFAYWERSGAGLDRLIEALFRLEEEGIGRRRNEGFGRVCVSDPFHFEVLWS